MKKHEEKPMFDFEGSQVEKFNDNHTDSGQILKDKNSRFGEIKGNQRGSSKEDIKSKFVWEVVKSPITIIVGVIIIVIAALFGL